MIGYVLRADGSFEYRNVEQQVPSGDVVRVAPVFVGLCGSDIHFQEQLLPGVEHPLALGHEIVGIALDGEHAGRPVAVDPVEGCGSCEVCRAGLEQLCASLVVIGAHRHGGLTEEVSVRAHAVHPLPADLPLQVAALAEVLAVAVRAVRRASLPEGGTALVVGGGPIGVLVAFAARALAGADVTVVETAERRRRFAAEFGFRTVDRLPGIGDVAQQSRQSLHDAVFDAAGAEAVAPRLTDHVRSGGSIVLVALYPDVTGLNVRDVVMRELNVVGTRACTAEDMRTAIELLNGHQQELAPLVADVVEPAGMAEALERMKRGEIMKVLVDCRGIPSGHL